MSVDVVRITYYLKVRYTCGKSHVYCSAKIIRTILDKYTRHKKPQLRVKITLNYVNERKYGRHVAAYSSRMRALSSCELGSACNADHTKSIRKVTTFSTTSVNDLMLTPS